MPHITTINARKIDECLAAEKTGEIVRLGYETPGGGHDVAIGRVVSHKALDAHPAGNAYEFYIETPADLAGQRVSPFPGDPKLILISNPDGRSTWGKSGELDL